MSYERGCVPAADARGALAGKAQYTTGIVYAPLFHCMRTGHAGTQDSSIRA